MPSFQEDVCGLVFGTLAGGSAKIMPVHIPLLMPAKTKFVSCAWHKSVEKPALKPYGYL